MIMVPGRIPDPHADGEPTTWWGGLIYAIGVLGFFIAWFAFWIWLYFEFFY